MPDYYELVPTARQRGSKPPQGWVQLAPGMNPKRRTMTEGYLNQRMPRGNTIAMNQNYVMKVLNNPKTPRENREVVIAYVLNHPDKFTPPTSSPRSHRTQAIRYRTNGRPRETELRTSAS